MHDKTVLIFVIWCSLLKILFSSADFVQWDKNKEKQLVHTEHISKISIFKAKTFASIPVLQ